MKEGLPFSILVVDDDEDDRMLIDEAFLAIGFAAEVKKFTDGKMLFNYLDELDLSLLPSLIVLDNTLPEMDAATIVQRLKENTSFQGIPVVIYTTTFTPTKEKQLLGSGVYACFEKGTTTKEIEALAKTLKEIATGNLQQP